MNVILPVAGLGTRLRPQTWSKPKPLVSVAGKTVIDHVLDRLRGMPLERVVFVTGFLGDQIESHIRKRYDLDTRFVVQPEQLGQSDAILRARDTVHGPTIIVFPDMVFEANLAQLNASTMDAAIFVMPVDDPSRFGVAVIEDDRITKLVEKPEQQVSNLAVMGIYYFADIDRLMGAIERQIDDEIRTKNEFFLADAMQIMIDDGADFRVLEATVWEDCGTLDSLLDTNRYLLSLTSSAPNRSANVIPPVYIAPDAVIEASVIGPYASVGSGATIHSSIVRDSIIDQDAHLDSVVLERSLIGARATIRGRPSILSIGDDTCIGVGENDERD